MPTTMPTAAQQGTVLEQASKNQAAAAAPENNAVENLKKSTEKEPVLQVNAKGVQNSAEVDKEKISSLAEAEHQEKVSSSPTKRKAPPSGSSSTTPKKPKTSETVSSSDASNAASSSSSSSSKDDSKTSAKTSTKTSSLKKQTKQGSHIKNQPLPGETHSAMLARKRAISRKSSRKLREREKQGLEERSRHASTLRERNIQLKAENSNLKSTIQLVKSMLAVDVASTGSKGASNNPAVAAAISETLAQQDAKPAASNSITAVAEGATFAPIAPAAKTLTALSQQADFASGMPPASLVAHSRLREQRLELPAASLLSLSDSKYQAKAKTAAAVSAFAPIRDCEKQVPLLDRLEQELQGRIQDVLGRNNRHPVPSTASQLGQQQQLQLLHLQQQQLAQQQQLGSSSSNHLESAMLELLKASRSNAVDTGSTKSSTSVQNLQEPLVADSLSRQPHRDEPQTSQVDTMAEIVSSLKSQLGGDSNTTNTGISAEDTLLARTLLLEHQHQQEHQRLLQHQQLQQLAQREPNLLLLLLQQEQQKKQDQQRLEQLAQQRAKQEGLQQLGLLLLQQQQQQQQPAGNATSLAQRAALRVQAPQPARQATAPSRDSSGSNDRSVNNLQLLRYLQQQQQKPGNGNA